MTDPIRARLAADDEAAEEFRDAHERAMRDHLLGGPETHICDDLCSDAILDRLIGRAPSDEYPPKPYLDAEYQRIAALREALLALVEALGVDPYIWNAGTELEPQSVLDIADFNEFDLAFDKARTALNAVEQPDREAT